MTPQDLIQQYVGTGLAIPTYQFSKLNPNQLKTYLRQRLIADSVETELITEDELAALSPDQLAQFIDGSDKEKLANFLAMNQNKHRDRSAKILGSAAFNKFDKPIIKILFDFNEYNENTVIYWILNYKQNITLSIIELMFKYAKNNYRGQGNVMADIIERSLQLNMNTQQKTEFLFLALLYYRSPHMVKALIGDESFQHINQKQFEHLLHKYSSQVEYNYLVELIDSFKSNKNVGLKTIPDELYASMVSYVRFSLPDTIKMIELLGKERLLTIEYPYLYYMIIELRPLEKRDEFISYLGDEIMSRIREDHKPMIYDK